MNKPSGRRCVVHLPDGRELLIKEPVLLLTDADGVPRSLVRDDDTKPGSIEYVEVFSFVGIDFAAIEWENDRA